MNQTPASNETKLGILGFEELNLYEALGFKKVWEFFIKNKEKKLTLALVNKAHKTGFDFLYDWAGKYRITNPMVGLLTLPPPHLLPELVKNLFDDLHYRLKHIVPSNIEEVVAIVSWFEYRFIWIHPYQNTNGRMGRLLSNVILLKLGYPPLTYVNRSKNRKAYINAMRKADNGDYTALENYIAKELDQAIQRINSKK